MNTEEAWRLVDEIAGDLRDLDIVQLKSYPRACFSFGILAGVVDGEPGTDLKDLATNAKAEQRPLVRLTCSEEKSEITV